MIIGIDASRAFLKRRTGIEEYTYQVIKNLRVLLSENDVVLYIRSDQEVSFEIPKRWRIKKLWAPRFWTQLRLSFEMLFHSPDVLFVPAHTVPMFHPSKTVVTVHGLEYEFCPEAYSFWERFYMRCSIKFSVRAASTIICVSENTKSDLMKLYNVPKEKIVVVYEGFSQPTASVPAVTEIKNPYFLFIGRLEERKNIVRMIETFEILKEQYQVPHTLMLAGKPGFGYEKIKRKIHDSKYRTCIKELGYVSEAEKHALLERADIFLFPALYEGFGIPVLDAQAAGVPVIASDISSLPEVGGAGAVYIDPLEVKSIVGAIQKILSDKNFRNDIIEKGKRNTGRFSWTRCSKEIAQIFSVI